MKFIITTGTCVVSTTIWRDDVELVGFKVSVEDNPAKYNTIGYAMAICVQINKLIGTPVFKVVSVAE